MAAGDGDPVRGESVLLVELHLPSGWGFAVRRGPDAAPATERGRLVVYPTRADAGGAADGEPWHRHDLVEVGRRLSTRPQPWDSDLLEAVLFVHEVGVALGRPELAEPTAEASELRRVAADRRLLDHISAASWDALSGSHRYFQGVPALELGRLQAQWLDVVSRLDAAVLWRPAPPAAAAGSAVPLEQVVPGLEVLWLAAGGRGGYTLTAGADPMTEQPTRFLGRPGTVEVFADAADLAAYLGDGAPPLPGLPAWHRLADAGDTVDLQPYEDNVVDLDELGELLRGLRAGDADRLLAARVLVGDLAGASGADDVLATLAGGGQLARLFDLDLPVIADGGLRAPGRLARLDGDTLAEDWAGLLAALAKHLTWR